MSLLKKNILPVISFRYVSRPLNMQPGPVRRLLSSAAILFEKTFERYGTLKISKKRIVWTCDEKPPVTASLEVNESVMTLEIHDDDSMAGTLPAIYLVFLFITVISTLSLHFFFYMKYFLFNPGILFNQQNLWMMLDKEVASLKWYIILSLSIVPVIAALLLIFIRRLKLFLLIKRKGLELQSALEELVRSHMLRLPLTGRGKIERFFDIRMNDRIELPPGFGTGPGKKDYARLCGAIDDFFQTGQFKGSLPLDMAENASLDVYARRSSASGDCMTSVTLYNCGDFIEIEAREDRSSEWFGTGGRMAAVLLFFWLASYVFIKDMIFELIKSGDYHGVLFFHVGILFTGFLIILAVSMISGLLIEVYSRNRRYRILSEKFRKLVDDARRIIRGGI